MLYGDRAEALVRTALKKRAKWTVTELAKETGLSRQSIYTLQKALGFELADGRTSAGNAVGAVCVDLSRRGILAYEARSPSAAVPIVADIAGELRRIAVREAGSRARRDSAAYDILALVDAAGAVTYRPELPSNS